MIKQWLETRRFKKKLEAARRGYDYAAGILLRDGSVYKRERIYELKCEADGVLEMCEEGKAFDKGILQACDDYEKLLKRIVT